MEARNPDQKEDKDEEREGKEGRDDAIQGNPHRPQNRKPNRAPENKALLAPEVSK